MEVEQRNRLIKRFLTENISKPGIEIKDEQLGDYRALAGAFDRIEQRSQLLFDFNSLEKDDNQWRKFSDILLRSSNFENTITNSPPSQLLIDEKVLDQRVEYWLNERALDEQPGYDYYRRKTVAFENDELQDLIIASRNKLAPIIRSFLSSETEFDPANNRHVENYIKLIKEKISSTPENDPRLIIYQNKLIVLEDLNKINQLKALTIPNESSGKKRFCILDEPAGGVTEKISLIALESVHSQLTNLNNSVLTSVSSYLKGRADFKLNTEAILKLPKHGKIEEVQREAMALNISRTLGLTTTQLTMVMHNNQPALFVPFDRIKLLNKFASGQIKKANFGFSNQTYSHYSIINAIGSGLQADKFIEDFGKAIGFIYICSDPDAIGGYIQNKALIDSELLYIFDQVFMPNDKLGLDSRLSLQPIQLILKHSRHGQGRNRSLIEDSSMVQKFNSILQLQQKRQLLIQLAERAITVHQIRINELNEVLKKSILPLEKKRVETELKSLIALQKDAIEARKNIPTRIQKTYEIFPKSNEGVTTDGRQGPRQAGCRPAGGRTPRGRRCHGVHR